ncbi:MAG: leucine-rich repeat protein [Oscillospiraceae bacterium]|nr:leucine-rich repeat protein [Oscillospiraceae bacterium]
MRRHICALFLIFFLLSFSTASAEGSAPQVYHDSGFSFYYSPDSGTLLVGGLGAVPNSASWSGAASGVRRLVIIEGVNSIPAGAFSGCVNLDSVLFPATLRHVDRMAFSGCNSIQTIQFPGDLLDLSQIIIENNVPELRKAVTISRIAPEAVNEEIDAIVNSVTSAEPAETSEVETSIAPFRRQHHQWATESSSSTGTASPAKPNSADKSENSESSTAPTVTPITETDKYNRITHQIEILDDGTVIETTSDYPGFDYPNKRSLVTVTAPDGTKTASYMEMDAGGNVFSQTDYTLDENGNVTGGTFHTLAGQPGTITAETDEDGNRVLVYTYPEESGIKNTKTEILNDEGQVVRSSITDRTPEGDIISTTEQTFTYDAEGTITSSTEVKTASNAGRTERRTEYEGDGRSNTETVTQYNAEGDVLYQGTTATIYEENGALKSVSTTSGSPESNQRTYCGTYTYDEDGNRTGYSQKTTEPNGTSWQSDMVWSYDENGKLKYSASETVYSDGNSHKYQCHYDEHGNLTYSYDSYKQADGPASQSTTVYDLTYGDNGNVILRKQETSSSDGSRSTKTTAYDSDGRAISSTQVSVGNDYVTSEQHFYTYDENGSHTIMNSQTKNADGSSSSTKQTFENGRTVSTESAWIYTDGRQSHHKTLYNENGSCTETYSDSMPDGYTYTQEIEYDEQGRTLSENTSQHNTNGYSSMSATTYSYDENGAKTAITTGSDSNGGSSGSTAVYDANGQIMTSVYEWQSADGRYQKQEYDGTTYTDYYSTTDQSGNKSTNTTVYNNAHQPVSSSGKVIYSDGTVVVSEQEYDENGRTSTYSSTTTFENGNQSTSVSTYEYDELGQASYTTVTTDSDGNTSACRYTYDSEQNIWIGTPVEPGNDGDGKSAGNRALVNSDGAEPVIIIDPSENDSKTAEAAGSVNENATKEAFVEPVRGSLKFVAEPTSIENSIPVEPADSSMNQNNALEQPAAEATGGVNLKDEESNSLAGSSVNTAYDVSVAAISTATAEMVQTSTNGQTASEPVEAVTASSNDA